MIPLAGAGATLRLALAASGASGISRDGARDAAARELSKPDYHRNDPSLAQRVMEWVVDKVAHLLQATADATPGGWPGLIVLIVVVALVVVAAGYRLGRPGRTARQASLLGGRRTSAAVHRSLALDHAAAGRWADAVRERMRAIARGLEERGALDARPGRTAREIAREVAVVAPELAAEVEAAAGAFEAIWYGGRPATTADERAAREADERLAAVRLHLPGLPGAKAASDPAAPHSPALAGSRPGPRP